MKKILTIFLAMILVMVGIVSALNGIEITAPLAGQNISEVVNVTWTNTDSVTGLSLQYKSGNCDAGSWGDLTTISGSSPKYYSWNTTEVADDDYCLRLRFGITTYNSTEAVFMVDNTKPTPSFTVTGTTIAGETLTFNASDSTDSGTGIETYNWDFGDDFDEGVSVTYSYSEAGDYNVTLTTTDFAGNTNSTTAEVSISEIEYEGNEIALTGVVEGIKNISYTWDTGLENVNCTSLTTGIPSGILVGNSSSNCTINWANIPFADIGGYNISIRANNETNVSWYRAELTVYTWMISLSENQRNFISVPYALEDDDYKTVFKGIKGNLDNAWSYVYNEDTKENKWVWMKYNNGWSRATGFEGWNGEVVPGRGYIVFMKNDDVLYGYKRTVSGESGDTPVAPAEVHLTNGYNLVGLFGDNSTETVGTALASLKSLGGNPYWYKVLDKNEAAVANDANMKPNTAYWISMKHLPDTATTDYYTYYL